MIDDRCEGRWSGKYRKTWREQEARFIWEEAESEIKHRRKKRVMIKESSREQYRAPRGHQKMKMI